MVINGLIKFGIVENSEYNDIFLEWCFFGNVLIIFNCKDIEKNVVYIFCIICVMK